MPDLFEVSLNAAATDSGTVSRCPSPGCSVGLRPVGHKLQVDWQAPLQQTVSEQHAADAPHAALCSPQVPPSAGVAGTGSCCVQTAP